MKEGRLFYYICPKCGEHVTTRVTDFNNIEVECKSCHHREKLDENNIFVRSHMIADTHSPKRYIGDILKVREGEFPMLLLPPPFRLFVDIARKYGMKLRYIEVDKLCAIYALRDSFTIKMFYTTDANNFGLAIDKIKNSINIHNSERAVLHSSSEHQEEYLVQVKDTYTSCVDEITDYLLYYLIDDKNGFCVKITGWKQIWPEMKDVIHDFELGKQLVDTMDVGY